MNVIEIVLGELSDNDLGLLQECRELQKAGFTVEEARGMMGGESHDLAIAVIQKVDEALERLAAPPSRKLAAKKKMRAAINGGIGGSARKSKSEPDMGVDYEDC